jgi:hypothetical protein
MMQFLRLGGDYTREERRRRIDVKPSMQGVTIILKLLNRASVILAITVTSLHTYRVDCLSAGPPAPSQVLLDLLPIGHLMPLRNVTRGVLHSIVRSTPSIYVSKDRYR